MSISLATSTTPADTSIAATDASIEQGPNRARRLALVAATILIALLATLLNAGGAQARTATITRTHTEVSWAFSVANLLNAERQAHHLPALKMNEKLMNSGRAHNLAMSHANTMSHQLRGEAYLGTRVTRAGYKWQWAGENIGFNGDISRNGVLALEKTMYNEVAPNNGHKLNILNTHFTNMGIDIYIDNTHHKVWLTCDFGRP